MSIQSSTTALVDRSVNGQTLKPTRGSTLAPEEHQLLGFWPQQRSVYLLSAEAIIVMGIYKSPVVQVVRQNMCKGGQRCRAMLSEADHKAVCDSRSLAHKLSICHSAFCLEVTWKSFSPCALKGGQNGKALP